MIATYTSATTHNIRSHFARCFIQNLTTIRASLGTVGKSQPAKRRKNVRHPVDFKVSLADCKALRIKMAAEKYLQKQVHFEMTQRQSKLKDFEEMLQNVKISNLEKLSKRLEKNSLLKEEQLVRVCCCSIETSY